MTDWGELGMGLMLVTFFTAIGLILVVKFSSPVVIDVNGLPTESPLRGEVADFLVVARHFADNHEYNKSGYNCVNYSDDLKRIADELGFETEAVIGCPVDNSSCHKWLRLTIDFEPISSQFTDYSKTYPMDAYRRDVR